MDKKTMSNRQFFAMTTAAMVAPLTVVGANINWITALLATFFAGLYIIIRKSAVPLGQVMPTAAGWRGLVCGAYLLATGVLTAYAAAMSMRAFPVEGLFPWLPLALLSVATWVAAKGEAAVARFAGILACLILPAMAVVLAFGWGEVDVANLTPTLYIGEGGRVAAVALLPLAGFWFPRAGKAGAGWTATTVVLAVAVSAVTVGALGALAGAVDEPFYMMTKSISAFGVMERFEGLVAAVLLLSFGCLLAYLGAISGRIWREWLPSAPEKLAPLPNLVMAGVAIWMIHRAPDWLPALLIGVFWVVLPLILGVVGRKGRL